MWIMARYYDGPPAKSPQGAVDYVGGHLEDSKEVGALSRVKGYLSREGLIEPVIDPEPWRRVGWDGLGLPPPRLLRNLCQGCDIDGNKVTRQQVLFRAPREIVISLPCELSEALQDDPESAHAVLHAAAWANLETLEEGCTRGRSGKGRKVQPDWVPAKPLALNYIHAQNRSGEPDLHLHVYIFPVVMARDDCRAFDNGQHIARLSKLGGARDRVTQAVVRASADRGYTVEIEPSTAKGNEHNGARVVCPDGRVIERGSVYRHRRAEILAAQEMRRELGLTPLTHREVERVRRETGEIPSALKGIRRKELLEAKLRGLGALDREGRILKGRDLLAALQVMEEGMAAAQVSLQGLKRMPHSKEAVTIVMNRRVALGKAEPEVMPDNFQARIRWIAAYDQALAMVATAPAGLRTDNLSKKVRDDLSKLKRAGILLGRKVNGRIVYTLSTEGETCLHQGQKDQNGAVQAVNLLVGHAMAGVATPALVRGRLESIGIQVSPSDGAFQIGTIGRVVVAPDLMRETGIQPDTPAEADRAWWQRWWDRRHDLPELLKQAILTPAEWTARWSTAAAAAAATVVRGQMAKAKQRMKDLTAGESAASEETLGVFLDQEMAPSRLARAPVPSQRGPERQVGR